MQEKVKNMIEFNQNMIVKYNIHYRRFQPKVLGKSIWDVPK